MPQATVRADLAAKFPEQAKELQTRLDNEQGSISSDLSKAAKDLFSSANAILDAAGSLPKSPETNKIISEAMWVIFIGDNLELIAKS